MLLPTGVSVRHGLHRFEIRDPACGAIGEEAIVAAGAVVTQSANPGDNLAGVPAKLIGEVAELDEKRKSMMKSYPVFKRTFDHI